MDGAEIRLRFDSLDSLRETLNNTFQMIERYVVPYRGEFFRPETTQLEVEWRRRQIYDSTAPVACDTLASKIHTNLTSPTIRWFELRFRNDELNAIQAAKEWLENVESRIWQEILDSDFGTEIAEVYLDLCSFGTAVLFEELVSEEEWAGITFTAIPIKDAFFEYGADDKLLNVYRRLQYTALQLKDKFPQHKFTDLEGFNPTDVDTKHDVIFCVYREPKNSLDSEGRMTPSKRPFIYKYVMHRSSEVLAKGGYYEMPAYVTRWKKVSGSQWGHSPAFICLSDILQLNETVSSTSEARMKEVDPPMKTTERGLISDLDLSSGGLTMVMKMDDLDRLLPPNPIAFSDVEITRLQDNVREVFFTNKLELKESPQMTATEVLARLQQMMELFAPTLGRLQSDLLDPLIERTYRLLGRNGQLPPPPEGLQEEQLDVVYIGPIPRAQRNEEAQGMERWLGGLAGLAQVMPDIMDIPDTDRYARESAQALGVSSTLLHTEQEVQEVRQARAEAEQAAQQLALVQQAGDAMKGIGEGQAALEGAE